MRRIDKCCGGCNHFKYEDMEGWGVCEELGNMKTHCSQGQWCIKYEDEETIRRHFTAVLIQYMRHHRQVYETNCPCEIYRMPNSEDISKAIDFAIKYMKGE